jgi:hypothetical protein
MSGRGEIPAEPADASPPIGLGEPVYNADGEQLGEVRGVEEGGFFVSSRDGIARMSIEHARSGQSFGEAELMWRCTECGEMGAIDDGFPGTCPGCGTERENIMYWTED